MKCLHCGKNFEAKRLTAKYCSTSCRVMYNRKGNKKTEMVEKASLHNQVMEALAEFKGLTKQMASDLLMLGQARTDGKPLTDLRPETRMEVRPTEDEPLSFDKLRANSVQQTNLSGLYAEMDNAETIEELEAIGRRIKASGMSWREQQKYHEYGKTIANKKFNL